MKKSLTSKKRETLSSFGGTFVAYFIAVFICEASLLVSICVNYVIGWFTVFTLICLIFLVVSILLAVSLVKKSGRKIENLFLIFGVPIIFAFCFFIIPTNTPDEPAHIMRLFDNRAGTHNLYIPEQLDIGAIWCYSDLRGFLTMPFDYSQMYITEEATAANYSEINYFLPSLVVSLGVALGINGWILVYAASFVNACLFILVGYYALKIMPFGKTVTLVLLMNPILLQQVTSTSADALCFISAIGFVSTLLYVRFSEDPVRPLFWILVVIFAIVLCLCKYVYLPVIGAAVLLLSKMNKKAILISLGVVLGVGVVFLVYFVVVRGVLDPDDGIGIILHRIFAFLGNPDFPALITNTIVDRTVFLSWQFAGGNLGWPALWGDPGQFIIPFFWVGYLITLLAAILHDGSKSVRFKVWERIWLAVIFVGGSFLIFLVMASTMYLEDQGTFKHDFVGNMQGRYFIPLVFCSIYACIPSFKNAFSRIPQEVFLGYVCLQGLASIVFIINQLWVVNYF